MNDLRQYLSFDSSRGYPAGPGLFYECINCGDVIASLPAESQCCSCGNLVVDVDFGRLLFRDPTKGKLFTLAENP